MSTKNITYAESVKQLEDILSKIENEDLDVDDLSGSVKKASELIKYCKKKLFETEKEIEDILKDIDSDEN